MLVACQLAGLSALGRTMQGHGVRAIRGDAAAPQGRGGHWRTYGESNSTPFEAGLAGLVDYGDGKQAEFSLDFLSAGGC
jgi:hypothetical protein